MHFKTYTYKTCPDGTKIDADVYFEPGSSSTTSKPIALLIHAGAWVLGCRSDIPRPQVRLLLELGFVPVSIDHRLCPTIGLYDGPVTDCRDALVWCQEELPKLLSRDGDDDDDLGGVVVADGSRVVAVGWSAGGHLALMLSQTPNPPLAILDFYGDTDLHDEFWHRPRRLKSSSATSTNTIDPNHSRKIFLETPAPTSAPFSTITSSPTPARVAWTTQTNDDGSRTMACIKDGDVDRVDPKTWYRHVLLSDTTRMTGSHAKQAEGEDDGGGDDGRKAFPPVMVIHGDKDEGTPLYVSIEMVECLKKMGGVAEIQILEGVGHAFDLVDEGEGWGMKELVGKEQEVVRKGYEFLTSWV